MSPIFHLNTEGLSLSVLRSPDTGLSHKFLYARASLKISSTQIESIYKYTYLYSFILGSQVPKFTIETNRNLLFFETFLEWFNSNFMKCILGADGLVQFGWYPLGCPALLQTCRNFFHFSRSFYLLILYTV